MMRPNEFGAPHVPEEEKKMNRDEEVEAGFRRLEAKIEKKDRFPTKAEVQELFEKLGAEGEITYGRQKEDAEGRLTVYEITVPSPTSLGEKIGYEYCSKGQHGGDKSVVTTIELVNYDENDIPYNGKTLADFVDGEWVFKP